MGILRWKDFQCPFLYLCVRYSCNAILCHGKSLPRKSAFVDVAYTTFWKWCPITTTIKIIHRTVIMENNNFVSSVNVVFYDENCLQLFSDNPGQKCWEGSVTFEIAPLPPYQCWILHQTKWWLFFQHWIWGRGATRACSFPNSSANS